MIRKVYKTLGGREVVRLLAETPEEAAELERQISEGSLPSPLDSLADYHAEAQGEESGVPPMRKAA